MHQNEIITTEQSSSVNVDTTWPVSILAAESLRIFAVLRKSSATVVRCLHDAIVSATDRATAVDYEYLLTLVPPHREGRISMNTVLTSLLLLLLLRVSGFALICLRCDVQSPFPPHCPMGLQCSVRHQSMSGQAVYNGLIRCVFFRLHGNVICSINEKLLCFFTPMCL